MQCKELEAIFASEGLSPLPPEAREHLSGCSHCQDLLADLSAILVAAKSIPAEVVPPERLWTSLRAQLEAEGVIREASPVAVPGAVPWWHSLAQFFQPRALATVAAALFLVAGAFYVAEYRNTNTNTTPGPTAAVQTPSPAPAQTNQASQLAASTQAVAPQSTNSSLSASNQTKSAHIAPAAHSQSSPDSLRPSPSENAYLGDSAAVLADMQDSLPSQPIAENPVVDASLRQNLSTINEFIAECETRLKQNPRDQLTREYLNMAYQQKADLLNAIVDSGRSEH